MAGVSSARIQGGSRQVATRCCERSGTRQLRRLAVWVVSVAALTVSVATASARVAPASASASVRSAATSGWTRLSVKNGWSKSPFGTSAPAVRVISGIVHFKGAMATTGSNPVPFILPAGFRPAAMVEVPVDLCNATNGRLQIQPNGTVTVQAENGAFANAACFTSLDGASFAR